MWENYDFVFAPCGPCGDLKEIPTMVYPPADQLLLIYCSDDGHRTALYTDGEGGTYKKVVENNAEQCNKHKVIPLTLGWRTKYKKIIGIWKPAPLCTITCEWTDIDVALCTISCEWETSLVPKCTITCTYNVNLVPKDNVIVTSKPYPLYIADHIENINNLTIVKYFPTIKINDKVEAGKHSVHSGKYLIQYSLKDLKDIEDKVRALKHEILDGTELENRALKTHKMKEEKVAVYKHTVGGGYYVEAQGLINYPRYNEDKVRVGTHVILSGAYIND